MIEIACQVQSFDSDSSFSFFQAWGHFFATSLGELAPAEASETKV